MIFIVGAIISILGIVQFIRFLIKSKRPKLVGHIQEITMDYYEKDTQKIKQHPHGLIKYVYQSIDYEKKLMLMKRKCQPGDKIQLAMKGGNPEKVEMYAPKAEFLTAVILFAIGAIIMLVCVAVLDTFNLW